MLISPLTRRKSYIEFFDKFKELQEEITPEFWDIYRFAKANQTPDFPRLKKKVSEFFMYKGDIERKTLNFPIQGSSAEITKISCIYIYDYILDHNLQNVVLFVNTVHDENVLECPLDIAQEIGAMVKDCMARAGDLFCKRVPLRAEPDFSDFWRK